MDQEPVNETQASPGMPKPVIPPPVILPPPVVSQAPQPPLSPLDSAPKSAGAAPATGGDGVPPVKVNIRQEGEEPLVQGSLASFNSRAVAVVIDTAVVMGGLIVLGFISGWLASKLSWLIFAGYMLTRDSLPILGGQSIGKRAMKIRAVTRDGQPLTGNWEAGIKRNIPLAVPFFGLVELFILLTREGGPDRGQRLGDEWGKTKVIVDLPPVVADEVTREE